jgi:hypothetical protein
VTDLAEIATDEEWLALELEQYRERPTNIIRDGCLQILDDSKKLVPFLPNRPQRRFLALVDWLRDQGLPVRIRIHKARQWGGSSVVDALLFADCITHGHQFPMILADDKSKSQVLYDRIDTFDVQLSKSDEYRHIGQERRPALGRAIKWANGSQISVATAEARESAGRAPTLTHLHASEKAFWPEQTKTMLGAAQAVPDDPGTVIVEETTANGVGDDWHEDVMRLVVRGEEGHKGPYDDGNDGLWFLLFVPWFEIEKYRMPLPEGQTLEESWSHLPEAELAPMREREPWLQGQGVDDEQLHWRRHRIVGKTRGSVDLFDQEFPDTPRRAFLGSGTPVFSARHVEALAQTAAGKVWTRGRLVVGYGAVEWQTDANGALEVLEHPRPGVHYAIGGDFAEGIEGDADSLHVMDRSTMREVAVWNAQMGTDHAGPNLEALARYYNMAVVAPEANSYGMVAVGHLRDHYDVARLYARPGTAPDKIKVSAVSAYGFKTDKVTKPLLISGLEEGIRNETVQPMHPATFHEIRVYERDPKTGKMGAMDGQHDDRVIGLALALEAHCTMPYLDEAASPYHDPMGSATGSWMG